MAKTNTSLHHLKNKILLATYIMRSLPVEDIHKTTSEPKERQRIRNTLVFLKREGFTNQKQSLRGDRFIHLTKKGYKYVTERVLKRIDDRTQYQHKEYRLLRKTLSEHSFMSFIYLWQYISSNADTINGATQIYEASDMNKCKISVYATGTSLVISPDIIIYTPDAKNSLFYNALCVENDNGREPYKMIYEKVVEYAVLADKGLIPNRISNLTLNFIFRSKQRIKQLFYDEQGIVRIFRTYNNTKQIKDVRIRTIILALNNSNFHINVSYFDDSNIESPYEFQEYNLSEMLLKVKPEWKIYT